MLNGPRLAAASLAVFVPLFAHAYIDPGTGSVLIQGIVAALAATGVALKLYWHRFVALFGKQPDAPTVSTAEPEVATPRDSE